MLFSDKFQIKTRYSRSANITRDVNLAEFLSNYIVTPTSSAIVLDFLNGVNGGQGAFIFTGPYGSGKSSLCLFLMCLLGKNNTVRDKALAKLEPTVIKEQSKQIASFKGGYSYIPITSRGESPVTIFSETLDCKNHPDAVIEKIEARQKKAGKVLIFVDEIGKILEAGQDIYFLQTIAELCNRADGKINLIACAHSAFSEYSRGKAKHVIKEWRKIQGRFFDVAVNTIQEEQLMLIGSAIGSANKPTKISDAVKGIIKLSSHNGMVSAVKEEKILNAVFPLHPVTAILLARFSGSQISQSNRSVFTFLSSPERYSFQEFLKTTKFSRGTMYTPDFLYDYIVHNLRNVIHASEFANTFSVAQESIRDLVDAEDAVATIKAIVLWQVFRPPGQLTMESQLLKVIFPKRNIRAAISLLEKRKNIRKQNKYGYAVSETTQFEVSEAKKEVRAQYSHESLSRIESPVLFRTIVGKRHLFEKGTIRNMDIYLASLRDIASIPSRPEKIGNFILIVPVNPDEEIEAEKLNADEFCKSGLKNILAIASNYGDIGRINSDIKTLEIILKDNIHLRHDKIAKEIVLSLYSEAQNELEVEISQGLKDAVWRESGSQTLEMKSADFSQKCSEIADDVYHDCIKINSELLNKNRIDSGGASGLSRLLKAMMNSPNAPRLGMTGYSAEASLYDIVLGNSAIHNTRHKDNPFTTPPARQDPCNIRPLWKKTRTVLSGKNDVLSCEDVFKVWASPPFGVKKGLMTVLMLAYIFANKDNIAVYIKLESRFEFHSEIDDFFIDTLHRRPHEAGLRFVSDRQKKSEIVSALYDSAMKKSYLRTPEKNEILEIAISYKRFVDALPTCTKTTSNISRKAIKFRGAIRNNEDPNKMVNIDIRECCPPRDISKITDEIHQYYPARIKEISDQIDNALNSAYKMTGKANLTEKIKTRIAHVKQHAPESEIRLLAQYLEIDDPTERTEKVIQLSTGKAKELWTDQVLNSSLGFINGQIEELLSIDRKFRLHPNKKVVICFGDESGYREVEIDRRDANALIKNLRSDGKRKQN